MSMHTALTGLNAAQTDLAATSHNIANVSTTGFRKSRTEFADVFHTSPYTVSRTTTGSGVKVAQVAPIFTQGAILATGNRLDMAIDGPGFFATQTAENAPGVTPELRFTRAGAFGMNADGTIRNAAGHQLLGWPVSTTGQALSEAMGDAAALRVPLSSGTAGQTRAIALQLRLPTDPAMIGAQAAVPPAAPFDPADATTWAHRTPVPAFDETGTPIEADAYFVRQANPDAISDITRYEIHLFRAGQPLNAAAPAEIAFDGDGLPVAGTETHVFGPAGQSITLNLGGSALADAPFEVTRANHDGTTVSPLTTLDVDNQGTIWAVYGSDNRIATGKLALVNFANPQGLRIIGNADFVATADSGQPVSGTPGSAGFGLLQSGALERANVDLTDELVNLISAQRNYQASAKALETSASMMQTVMNIRT